MTTLFPVALFIAVASLSPGPNNLAVMRTAAWNGWTGAMPAVAGIVSGGLVLLAIVAAGAGRAFFEWPWLRVVIEVGGALYLIWLGACLCIAAGCDGGATSLPAGMRGLFVFQFLNPKGWMMVLTAVAALPAKSAASAFLHLAPLFILIPALGLLLWAGLGGAMASGLARPLVHRWTDRVLGALLVLAAALLFV